MKMFNSFAKMMAFFLAAAMVATALPSNTDGAQLMSPHSPLFPIPSKGINCDGNFGCEAGYCPPNSTMIKNMIAEIDDNAVFKNFQNIACARCATKAERPADYRQGICLYATKLKSGTVTGKVVKDSVSALIKNGCKRCGSVPVVPGAKDDADGNIQINFTRAACETGLCPGIKQDSAIDKRDDDSTSPEEESAGQPNIPSEIVPSISKLSDSPDLANPLSPDGALLGINCRGNALCNDWCMKKAIMELGFFMDQLNPDHHNNYTNGQKIACVRCKLSKGTGSAICAFPQSLPEGQDMDYGQIKSAMKAIVDHGCRWCGSVPIYPGNNVKSGQLTVNYVYNGCGDGICEH